MIKPDGVQRGLIAPILDRFLAKGYTLRGLRFLNVSRELAERHYADLSSKPFFPSESRRDSWPHRRLHVPPAHCIFSLPFSLASAKQAASARACTYTSSTSILL
jgi:hypothetical protein